MRGSGVNKLELKMPRLDAIFKKHQHDIMMGPGGDHADEPLDDV